MLDKARLIKAPTITAEEVNDDGYILIDSESAGLRKYQLKKLLPTDNSLYNWDFTQSLTDKVEGLAAELRGGASRDENGVHLSSASDYVILGDVAVTNRTYEIELGTVETHGTGNKRLFMWTYGQGFIFRGNPAAWHFYDGSWKTNSLTAITDRDFFSNSIMKIVFEGTTAKVYKDDVLVYQNNNVTISSTQLWLGSSSSSQYNVTIKKMKIYNNLEV